MLIEELKVKMKFLTVIALVETIRSKSENISAHFVQEDLSCLRDCELLPSCCKFVPPISSLTCLCDCLAGNAGLRRACRNPNLRREGANNVQLSSPFAHLTHKNSLNVASACPVVVFEVLRQWGKM